MLQRFMLKSQTVSFRGTLVVFNLLLICAYSQGYSETVMPSSESSTGLSAEKPVQNSAEKFSLSARPLDNNKSKNKMPHLSKGSTSKASSKNIPGLETVVVDPSEDVVPLVDEKHPSKELLKDELQKLVELQKTMQQQITELQAKIEKTDAQAKKSTEKINMLTRKTGATGRALDTLLQRTKLSGYVEQGWRAYTYAPRTAEYLGADGSNGNTFNLRKYVVRNSAQFSDKASWVAEVEYEDAGKNEITVEQSEFIYNYKPWLTARAGLIIPTVTPINVNHEGTNRYLVDRPLVDQLIMPTTYRDLGVGISGFVPVLKKSAFNYELNLFNGFTDRTTIPAEGRRVSDNIGFEGLHDALPQESANGSQFLDNNKNKAIHGRIGFVPVPGLELAVGGYFSRIAKNSNQSLSLITGDLRWRYKKWSLLGEYVQALYHRGSGVNPDLIPYSSFPSALNGHYLEIAYNLTPKVAAIAAWNYVNLDTAHSSNQSMSRVATGVRYNPLGRVYLKGEYQITFPRNAFRPQERTSHGFITQLTFDF